MAVADETVRSIIKIRRLLTSVEETLAGLIVGEV
jgi:hypothetical protein